MFFKYCTIETVGPVKISNLANWFSETLWQVLIVDVEIVRQEGTCQLTHVTLRNPLQAN